MKEFPLNRGRVTLVDDDTYHWLANLGYKWHVSSSGYVVRFYGRKMVTLSRFLMNPPVGFEVDHIDRNKLNNQKSNLRLCNKTQNQGNRFGSRRTGFKGTRWYKRCRKWEAYITKGGKYHFLGLHDSEIDAAKAYNVAALEHFGEFARLNEV